MGQEGRNVRLIRAGYIYLYIYIHIEKQQPLSSSSPPRLQRLWGSYFAAFPWTEGDVRRQRDHALPL